MHADNPDIALACFRTIPHLARYLDADILAAFVGARDECLARSASTYFEIVAEFLDGEVAISPDAEAQILEMLLDALNSPPEVFEAVLSAISNFLGRSERHLAVVLQVLGPLFADILESEALDFAPAVALFISRLETLFGDSVAPFVTEFSVAATSILFRNQEVCHFSPIQRFSGDVNSLADVLLGDCRIGSLHYHALSSLAPYLDTEKVLAYLQLAFAFLLQVEPHLSDRELCQFVDGVFCNTIEKCSDPELLATYLQIGDLLMFLVERGRGRDAAPYRFLTHLAGIKGNPNTANVVSWVLSRIGKPKVIGCIAEFLDMKLISEENMHAVAVAAFSAVGGDVFAAHAILELVKLNIGVEIVIEQMGEFMEWFALANDDLAAALAGILITIAIDRQLDVEIPRAVIAKFPETEACMFGSVFAERIIAIAKVEAWMAELAGDVMMALGRYFGSRPAVRTGMGLGSELVAEMTDLFAALVNAAGVDLGKLADAIGPHEIIKWRLEMVLGSGGTEA
jgi:hypothetical protein